MSVNDSNRKGPRTEVIVALIGLVGIISVALIENWDTLFDQAASTVTPTPVSSAPISDAPTSTPVSSPTASATPILTPASPSTSEEVVSQGGLADCKITITRPLVALMSEPDTFSRQIIRVDPGEYTPLNHTIISTMIGEEGWFQLEVEGHQGWISDDTMTIYEKTQACP
ncbi:MAG: hypothetical protein SFY66_20700 [Oculatellaceae cyanobacterium bins.114]|nr:hypothetical protein [Oculatellaceae cyanobacterium bins.114]